MNKISVVIPALNEEKAIGPVIKEIPINKLKKMGYSVEVIVVDNGSHDNTPHIARSHGAKVIYQPIRGYGNAYKAGFDNAHGDIIATGDADLTYPFSILPEVVHMIKDEGYDFINTDRMTNLDREVMTGTHFLGNKMLSAVTKVLFRWPYVDSQSGMWIFKQEIWDKLNVYSSGMPFSEELKIEAHVRGFKCAEIPIDYRARAGEVKISTLVDGWDNMSHLFIKRLKYGLTLPKKITNAIEDEFDSKGENADA